MRKLLYHDSAPWNYATYDYGAEWIETVDFGATLFGQLMVVSDIDYYLGARVLLGDEDLDGAIELGAQVQYSTSEITPDEDTLDKLPGLIDGLPGDHTAYGWWSAFDTVSATLVRVSG